jgi:hypothetical protein
MSPLLPVLALLVAFGLGLAVGYFAGKASGLKEGRR